MKNGSKAMGSNLTSSKGSNLSEEYEEFSNTLTKNDTMTPFYCGCLSSLDEKDEVSLFDKLSISVSRRSPLDLLGMSMIRLIRRGDQEKLVKLLRENSDAINGAFFLRGNKICLKAFYTVLKECNIPLLRAFFEGGCLPEQTCVLHFDNIAIPAKNFKTKIPFRMKPIPKKAFHEKDSRLSNTMVNTCNERVIASRTSYESFQNSRNPVPASKTPPLSVFSLSESSDHRKKRQIGCNDRHFNHLSFSSSVESTKFTYLYIPNDIQKNEERNSKAFFECMVAKPQCDNEKLDKKRYQKGCIVGNQLRLSQRRKSVSRISLESTKDSFSASHLSWTVKKTERSTTNQNIHGILSNQKMLAVGEFLLLQEEEKLSQIILEYVSFPSLFMVAACFGCPAGIVERLLLYGANPNSRRHNLTPINVAACSMIDAYKKVSLLLKFGASPNLSNFLLSSARFPSGKNTTVLEYKSKISFSTCESHEKSFSTDSDFHFDDYAAAKEGLRLATQQVIADSADLPALMCTVMNNDYDMTLLLLEAGANPNIFVPGMGLPTPLFHCVFWGRQSLVDLLLLFGADTEATKETGESIIMTAQNAVSFSIQKKPNYLRKLVLPKVSFGTALKILKKLEMTTEERLKIASTAAKDAVNKGMKNGKNYSSLWRDAVDAAKNSVASVTFLPHTWETTVNYRCNDIDSLKNSNAYQFKQRYASGRHIGKSSRNNKVNKIDSISRAVEFYDMSYHLGGRNLTCKVNSPRVTPTENTTFMSAPFVEKFAAISSIFAINDEEYPPSSKAFSSYCSSAEHTQEREDSSTTAQSSCCLCQISERDESKCRKSREQRNVKASVCAKEQKKQSRCIAHFYEGAIASENCYKKSSTIVGANTYKKLQKMSDQFSETSRQFSSHSTCPSITNVSNSCTSVDDSNDCSVSDSKSTNFIETLPTHLSSSMSTKN